MNNRYLVLSAENIKALAGSVGFHACGIAEAAALSSREFELDAWLSAGFQADMHYMERNADKRRDPRLLMEGAKSVISVLLAYKPDSHMEGSRKIAQYAYGEDYHERIKRMLYQLIECLREHAPDIIARAFVDTAPISDRHWAARAGLGWIGCNTLLVNPQYGSYCFIGELVTDAEVDRYDEPLPLDEQVGCGDCRKCVEACPNHAIRMLHSGGTYHVDARRCTSYNTIENHALELPVNLETRGYVFGCDICQLVCPFNDRARTVEQFGADRRHELEALFEADETAFQIATCHSAISRIDFKQWKRNIIKSESNSN